MLSVSTTSNARALAAASSCCRPGRLCIDAPEIAASVNSSTICQPGCLAA
jgi:hypothetical protein